MENFSVLMSVYYKERPEFFDLSLESNLVTQTLKPNEFVLICDGALTPELESVISKYQALFPDILKVYRKENGGLGKALNFGLPKCSYPLVARADSDDVSVPERFQLQVKYFEEHPEVGIIGGNIEEFLLDWHITERTKKMPLKHEELCHMAALRNPLNHMTVMMRRDVILRIGSYRHMPFNEDYDLWVRAIISGVKIANINKVLVHARIGNGMIRRRSNWKCINSRRKIGKNLMKAGMINRVTYMRNLGAFVAFEFMPTGLKKCIYKNILRKS